MDHMSTSSQKSLIFDIGNANTKFGLSSELRPHPSFDTVVRTKLFKAGASSSEEPKQTGKQVNHPCLYKFDFPIQRGHIKSEDDLAVIIRYILEETKSKTLDNIPVLICDNSNSSAKQKYKFADMLANDFKSSTMYFADQAILALYGMGKSSGCVLDVGHGTSQIACVFDNFKITQCCDAINLGGYDIERKLATLLHQNGTYINSRVEFSLLRQIKQDYCELLSFDNKKAFDSGNFKELLKNKKEEKLPDGENLNLEEARFLAPETLFRSDQFQGGTSGIHNFLKQTIERADVSMKNEFYSDINVVGGVAKTVNFLDRLRDELRDICHKKTQLIVKHKTENEGYEAWYGAKVVVSSNSYDFSNLWITKTELSEFGEQIIYRKCI